MTQINTFAKLNLQLLVGPVDASGFHPLHTVFQAIDLNDTLTITKTSTNSIEITCTHPDVPVDDGNILSKIYTHFKNDIPFGLNIHIEKRIPIGGGLGGGSSNAAGLLYYLNREANWNYTTSDLARIATQFGTDIPAFLFPSPSLGQGYGNAIDPLKQTELLHAILINPQLHMATPKLYKQLDNHFPPQALENRPKPENQLGPNDFKAILWQEFPEFSAIENALPHPFTLHVSGSGSTCFIPLERTKSHSDIEDLLRYLSSAFPNYVIKYVRSRRSHIEHMP